MRALGVERLLHIVPRLVPFDGVADYALHIAERLRVRHGVPGRFIEAGTRQRAATGQGADDILRCDPGSATGLSAAIEQAVEGKSETGVLLHYVGYGYADRGAPLWLLRALVRARRVRNYRLGVIFHELYASGRPWQSSFWLGWLQKAVVTGIARECDGALLTREGNRMWLNAAGALSGKSVAVLPVPSTVGEPTDPARPSARERMLVVWGSTAMKARVYGEYWETVVKACGALGIDRIIDLGARALRYPGADTVGVDVRGQLPAADISGILSGARFGALVYPASFLAKSSLFAAYAAHGVVPLLLDGPGDGPMDGLEAGRHFLPLSTGTRVFADTLLDEVAFQARAWYSEHTLERHAAAVRMMFQVSA